MRHHMMAAKKFEPESLDPSAKAREWLARRLQRGQKERFAEDVDVTLDIALAMLEKNENNRPVRHAKVAQFSKMLRNGQFKWTHQGIAFDFNGKLFDGQHRLEAIVATGYTANMQVTFGCDPDTFQYVDYGTSRTAADLMYIHGDKYASLRATIAKKNYMIETGAKETKPPQGTFEYALTMPQDLLDESCKWGMKGAKITSQSAVGIAYYYIATHTKHLELMDEFWNKFVTGTELKSRDPILQVRELLLQRPDFGARSGGDLATKEAAAIVQAWNRWILKKSLGRVKWEHTTSLPEVE